MSYSFPSSLAALPRISVRKFSNAGPVLQNARLTPANLLLDAEELVLLIHGYNNSELSAFESYRAFMENLGSGWASCVSGIFWPGDGSTNDPDARQVWNSVLFSAISYPLQPRRAEESASYLADTITLALSARLERANRSGRAPRNLVLNIVAHSMGCRLALELLKLLRSALRGGAPLRIRNVALMAAAVPQYDTEFRGSFHLALNTPDKTTVFWSRSDRVLRMTFPLGQVLAWPFPLGWDLRKRSALGRFGMAERNGLSSVEVDLDHSDYWSDRFIASVLRTDLDSDNII